MRLPPVCMQAEGTEGIQFRGGRPIQRIAVMSFALMT